MNGMVIDDFREESDDLLNGLTFADITRQPTTTAIAGAAPFSKVLSDLEYSYLKKLQHFFDYCKSEMKSQRPSPVSTNCPPSRYQGRSHPGGVQ